MKARIEIKRQEEMQLLQSKQEPNQLKGDFASLFYKTFLACRGEEESLEIACRIDYQIH